MKPMCLLHYVVISLLAAGCATVGPDFVPPTPQAPAQWHGELTGGLSPAPPNKAALSQWWTTFNDPQLTDLIARAITGSLDLRAAAARIREPAPSAASVRASVFLRSRRQEG